MSESIEKLRISVGKTQREIGIDISKDDSIYIQYETGCMGEYDTESTSSITAEDLFEIISNLRMWSMKQADVVTQEKIKQLEDENEQLRKEVRHKDYELKQLKSAFKILKVEI